MGLDMTLTRKYYIGAEFECNEVKIDLDVSIRGVKLNIDPQEISEISTVAFRWRKSNQIHKWFVDNIQNEEDNRQEYEVETKELHELLRLCLEVLRNKEEASQLLPNKAGFFFGDVEYNEDYFADLKDTAEGLKSILSQDNSKANFYYSSSW